MDLVSGFFQCSIEEDSVPITAVVTQQGLFEFLSVPQGLSSSPGWFHSVMARVCEGLEHAHLFIDDIIIVYSGNGAEHVRDLERFFERLIKYNLKLAQKKSNVGVKKVTFLGQVTAAGISPCPEKVKPLLLLIPMPQKCQAVEIFAGLHIILSQVSEKIVSEITAAHEYVEERSTVCVHGKTC